MQRCDKHAGPPSQPGRLHLVHITTVPYALFYVSGQVRYMKARGFEVSAVSSPGPLLDRFAREENVKVKTVMMARAITPISDLWALKKIWAWFMQLRPAIVHAHTPKGGLLGVIGAWLAGVPVRIYHLHGLRFENTRGWKRSLLIRTERLACRLATQVLCVSASVQALARDAGLCPPGKIKVLLNGSCNGVDSTGRFNPSSVAPSARREVRDGYGIPRDALVVGFVGRICWSKGITDLVEAWRRLRADYPTLHLLLVGPIEPEDPLSADVLETLRSDPRIHLVGDERETPPLFAAMDALVLPTHREGLPIVLLEAASMMLPIVATRVAGCVDVVEDGVSGTLVPPYDAGALAVAIRRYLDDPALRSQHGQAARERVVRAFRQEVLWQAIYQEYVRCLRAKNLLPPISESRTPLSPADLASHPSQ